MNKVLVKVSKRYVEAVEIGRYPDSKAVKVLLNGEEWIVRDSQVFTQQDLDVQNKAKEIEKSLPVLNCYIDEWNKGKRTAVELGEIIGEGALVASNRIRKAKRLGLI